MKLSESWLRDMVNPCVSTQELSNQLTMAGLEVDGVAPVSGLGAEVVVSAIVKVEVHPDVDGLLVCHVDYGGGLPLEVVCGAPNARVGIKVPLARIGATLPGGIKIKEEDIRGIMSQGMLCGQLDLQLGEDNDRLWELDPDAPIGTSIRQYLNFQDNIFEMDLTPNRGDCLSIVGMAREVGVLNELYPRQIECIPVKPTIEDIIDITIDASEACGRYVGRIFRGINVSAPTPRWMLEKLNSSGIRSRGAVVDITNYVMLELGQPMHAFDLSKIEESIVVRMGCNEELKLLDDSNLRVGKDTLLIADSVKPLALAGIMGGKDSAVGSDTHDILLESAWFTPLAIAGKARTFNKQTDSSHRFERGVDSSLQEAASERATSLLINICGGFVGPMVCKESIIALPEPQVIYLTYARLSQQLGVELSSSFINKILLRLGLENLKQDDDGSLWRVPSWRFDLSIQEDLIEEVGRIYGYDNIPTRTPLTALSIQPYSETKGSIHPFREQLVANGFQEVLTYSFVNRDLQELIVPKLSQVSIRNPISSDKEVMRASLWPGLLHTAFYNLNRQKSRIRLFESGACFHMDNEILRQNSYLAGLACGAAEKPDWLSSQRDVDFFDLKGVVESLLSRTGRAKNYQFAPSKNHALHPGRTAEILIDGKQCGWMGQLHPQIQRKLGQDCEFYLFQIILKDLLHLELPQSHEISRYPEVRRDLSFLVSSTIQASKILECVREAAGELLISLEIFDVYEGDDNVESSKSLALSLSFQHAERTLFDAEIDAAVESVVVAVEKQFSAKLRGGL